MGYYFMVTACGACHKSMTCNPHYVPVLVIETGKRIEICETCHAQWNEIHRISKGLDPQPLHPQAYEPQEE